MKCEECDAPTGFAKDGPFLTKSRFKFSETAQVIEKIKRGFDCPKPNLDSKLLHFLSLDLDLQNPEVAYRYGYELAMFQCGEILAEAQENDK